MKRYFVNGKEISEEEAKKQGEENIKLWASKDINDYLKIKFITVVNN